MSHRNLSKIKKVEVRQVWRDEARDFTPWLEEHIGELGEALGIRLEAQERESSVGSRSLDIMATDDSGRTVIIENQLGDSDVDHLGRLLIYAAGKDADVIIWIARGFKDEHWQVLQWLNQRTGTESKFFGVAIEVWTIDGSRPAPHFRVVAAPNDWQKRNLVSKPPRKGYRRFRVGFEEKLKELVTGLPLDQARDHYQPHRSLCYADGIRYSIDFRDLIYFSFQLDPGDKGDQSLEWCRSSFDRIHKDKDSIEKRLGELEWKREWQGDRGSAIESYYPERFSELSDWEEVHLWGVERYRLFREVFEPYRVELLRNQPSP